jgi:hypothetical protein
LANAYAIAASPPGYVNQILIGSYHYTPERIMLLRSDTCPGTDSSVAPTEYWIVPSGTALPLSIERIKLCQIMYKAFGDSGALSGERDYKAELQKMTQELRLNPKATGFVVGNFINRPSRGLQRRMRECERILESSGLPRTRYMVHTMHWTGEHSVDPAEPEPKRPTLFAVELTDECGTH